MTSKGVAAARKLAQTARGKGEGLTWFEIHAARIQEMLDRPFGDWTSTGHGDTKYTWEAVYQLDEQTVVAFLWRVRDSDTGVRLTFKATPSSVPYHQIVGDVTANEITNFLGLGSVDPASFAWRFFDYVKEHAPTFAEIGGQIVRGRVPNVKAN